MRAALKGSLWRPPLTSTCCASSTLATPPTCRPAGARVLRGTPNRQHQSARYAWSVSAPALAAARSVALVWSPLPGGCRYEPIRRNTSRGANLPRCNEAELRAAKSRPRSSEALEAEEPGEAEHQAWRRRQRRRGQTRSVTRRSGRNRCSSQRNPSRRPSAAMRRTGILLALEALPKDMDKPDRPYVVEAEAALYQAVLEHRELYVLGGQLARSAAAFSPDGTRVVTASDDSTARLWDAAIGQGARHPGRPHWCVSSRRRSARTARAWSPASDDETARLWDAATGQGARHPAKATAAAVTVGGVQPGRHAHRHGVGRQDRAAVGRGHRARRSPPWRPH